MTNAEQILTIAKNNNGMVTSTQVTKAGISREFLRILVNKGLLTHSERGVYLISEVFEDEMFNLQNRFSRGIFSHETSLFLLGLTDQTPIKYAMTFPLSYNTGILKSENVNFYRVKDDLYELGVIYAKSPAGNMVKLYNAERTICDILQGRSNTGIQTLTYALKSYVRLNNKDIPLLSKYAQLLRVDKKLRSYMEVLL